MQSMLLDGCRLLYRNCIWESTSRIVQYTSKTVLNINSILLSLIKYTHFKNITLFGMPKLGTNW